MVIKNKELIGAEIVGTGSDFIVIEKEKTRYLIEVNFKTLKELKNSMFGKIQSANLLV